MATKDLDERRSAVGIFGDFVNFEIRGTGSIRPKIGKKVGLAAN